MRLVLIGDVHVYRLLVPPWRLMSKRALGMAHLWLKRQFKFRRRQVVPLLDRVASIKPDLVLFSGDLTTTALEAEFGDMHRLLKQHLPGLPILVVPGNHDRYTYRSARLRVMEQVLGTLMPERFPSLRLLGSRWHLLALDSARPRRLSARGEIGAEQMAAAAKLTAELPAGDGLVILCHYPLILPSDEYDKPGHRLVDEAALQRLVANLSQRVSVVFVHGHVHQPWFWRPTNDGLEQVLTINAGAPCLPTRTYPAGQGFWQIDLQTEDAGAPFLQATHHIPQVVQRPRREQPAGVDPSTWITRRYP